MKIYTNFEEAGNIRNPVVTTGSFDGVHIGHKTILNRLNYLAGKYDGESVLITFDPHPRKVLYPDTAGKDLRLICSLEEKLDLLGKAGLDNVIIIEFTREFSKITSEQFVRDYLHGILHARIIVVGFNHHFGFNKEGDYRQLWGWQAQYNFAAEEIPEQEVQNESVSSTKIRKAISEGYIQRANAYLDHYYMIMGRLVKGTVRWDQERTCFSELVPSGESKLLPPPGIYAVSVETDARISKAMALVVQNSGNMSSVMVDIFDDDPAGSEKQLTCYFHKKIHGALYPDDIRTSSKIMAAKEEIMDLIY